jgi:hypothetical protein
MSRLCRLKCNSHGEDGKWAYDEIVSLRKARDQLIEQFKTVLDENKTLKSALQHEVDVAEAYKAEADSLRKDAERYRWLRVADQATVLKFSHYAFDALDAAIDTAIRG